MLWPMGSHWVQTMGQNRKNYHAQKFEFLATPPRCHRFFAKNRSYGYGAKSRWGPPRVHLGVNGVSLGKKNGSKPQKMTMPQNSIFLQKMEGTVMAPNQGGDTLGSIFGPMGSQWVP